MPDRSRKRVNGWKLEPAERRRLLKLFPPRYGEVVADHVTLSVGPGLEPPPQVSAEIVGHTDDGAGVQALAVRIDGTTARPDGSVYHLTWSLGPGRRAVESNDVLRARGFSPVDPEPITLKPAVF